MKEHINKIILVVIITLSVAATWLYTNPGNVATDSGFDTSYDGGSGGYSGGGSSWSSSGDSSGLSNNDLEEWKKLSTPEKLLTLMPLWLHIIIGTLYIYFGIYRDSPRALSLNKNKAILRSIFVPAALSPPPILLMALYQSIFPDEAMPCLLLLSWKAESPPSHALLSTE